MGERYRVEAGSGTGHCCFDATVVDTSRPMMVAGEPCGFEEVCECLEVESAELVAQALNLMAHARSDGAKE